MKLRNIVLIFSIVATLSACHSLNEYWGRGVHSHHYSRKPFHHVSHSYRDNQYAAHQGQQQRTSAGYRQKRHLKYPNDRRDFAGSSTAAAAQHHPAPAKPKITGMSVGQHIGQQLGTTVSAIDVKRINTALESTKTNKTKSWSHSGKNSHFAVTPKHTYNQRGRPCRDYVADVIVSGQETRVSGTACRDDNGQWHATR